MTPYDRTPYDRTPYDQPCDQPCAECRLDQELRFDDAASESAPGLLGWCLESGHRGEATLVSGTIVEVEAYGGADDPASHAHRGRTGRNASMFAPAGTLYVYRIYGMHWCANVAWGPSGEGTAVLLRAIRPEQGLAMMAMRRPKATSPLGYASGPGKLAAAFGITSEHDGVDLFDPTSPIRLVPPATSTPHARILAGPRIGITKAVERPWRFAVAGDDHVSRPRTRLEPWRPAR